MWGHVSSIIKEFMFTPLYTGMDPIIPPMSGFVVLVIIIIGICWYQGYRDHRDKKDRERRLAMTPEERSKQVYRPGYKEHYSRDYDHTPYGDALYEGEQYKQGY